MASDWPATSKWNYDYLSVTLAEVTVEINARQENLKDEIAVAYYKDAISLLRQNVVSNQQKPKKTFLIENNRIRSNEIRNDYEFPYLHEIVRFHWAGLSLLPKDFITVPRQYN